MRTLSHAELLHGDVSLAYVSKLMRRHYPETDYIKKVLQTIWHQVNNAQEIYAVGTVLDDDTVMGGTGWGAEFGKLCNKPVFVFDQQRDEWLGWSGTAWQPARTDDHPPALLRQRHPPPEATTAKRRSTRCSSARSPNAWCLAIEGVPPNSARPPRPDVASPAVQLLAPSTQAAVSRGSSGIWARNSSTSSPTRLPLEVGAQELVVVRRRRAR